MGIIQRQSIKQSLVNYLATGIAALSSIFIYPKHEEIYGLAIFIIGSAIFLAPFVSMGINSLSIRFFPDFEDKANGNNGFLGMLIGSALGAIVITSILAYLLQGLFLELLALLNFKPELFVEYGLEIWILCILIIFSNILNAFTSNFQRIVVPSIFINLLPKISLPLLVLLFAGQYLQVGEFTLGILLLYVLIVIGLGVYVGFLGQFNLNFNKRKLKPALVRKMGEYTFFGLLGSMGSLLATRIDTIMIPSLLTLTSTGIYAVSMFIGSAIEIPARSIINISSPLIVQAWQKKDYKEIQMIYTKSSINLFLVGLLAFVGIWISIEDIYQLSANYEGLVEGKMVVLFIALSKLVDMLTSVNGQIIGYSKLFRFNLYTILVLGIVNFYLNLILIPEFGITGAAVATFCSVSLFNLLKVGFIWFRFKMHPFSINTLKLLLIAPAAYFLAYLIPDFQHPLANIIKNSICVGTFFVLLVIIFKVSEDFTKLLKSFILRQPAE